ncbi:hypothetical protein QFZ65_002398 [Arthrobacter sp. B3I9]|uniref:hypothetical protein n=1 Tax=Arthrobacter sp. B3I9 TaxID=3042270 RepID=UPI00278F8E15|nr:hypothetical protein [Arthrobacter sp. B3I9]MDQ0850460.1 hypothetical protein [Arthrobacter sp. B3I9]
MTATDYARFLTTCVRTDPNLDEGLADDELYGVYISWCFLQRMVPAPSKAFWMAMQDLGIRGSGRSTQGSIRLGLRMTGPAAVDYILARRPVLV